MANLSSSTVVETRRERERKMKLTLTLPSSAEAGVGLRQGWGKGSTIEIREKRLADNRHINYQMLGEKGTKLYFSSLKSRTLRTKINMLGTDTQMTQRILLK